MRSVRISSALRIESTAAAVASSSINPTLPLLKPHSRFAARSVVSPFSSSRSFTLNLIQLNSAGAMRNSCTVSSRSHRKRHQCTRSSLRPWIPFHSSISDCKSYFFTR